MGPPEELSSSPMGTWPCTVIVPANLFPLCLLPALHTFPFDPLTWVHSVLSKSLFHKLLFALSKAKPTCMQGGKQRQQQIPASDKKKPRSPGESEQRQPATLHQNKLAAGNTVSSHALFLNHLHPFPDRLSCLLLTPNPNFASFAVGSGICGMTAHSMASALSTWVINSFKLLLPFHHIVNPPLLCHFSCCYLTTSCAVILFV